MAKTVDRILLYLDEYQHTRNDFTAPLALTQAEMARALGVDRAHLSRVMNRMETEGVAISEKKHVETRKKRVKVYYLTDTGRREVDKLRRKGGGRKKVELADDRPRVWHFYGREQEMEEFKDWSASSNGRIMVVKGIAGIGKTCFISKAIDRNIGDTNLFWYRFNQWSGLKHLLLRMSTFFSKMGKRKLEWYIDSREDLDIGEISLLLAEDLEKVNAVMVFDDYHKVAKDDIKELMGSFVALLPQLNSVKIIVAGREVPRFHYDIRDVAFSKTVVEMELHGLDITSSSKMLKMEKVDDKMHEKIFYMTKGHPLALSLFKTGSEITASSMAEYLGDEVIAQLSKEEKTIMEVAAAFRRPVQPTAYLDIAAESLERTQGTEKRIEYEIVDNLAKKSLFYISADGYSMHDLLKDLFYTRTPSKLRDEYHQLIANYYLKEQDPSSGSLIEALFHLVFASNYVQAAELIAKMGKDLMYEGYGQEVLNSIDGMPLDDVDKKDRPWISLFRAEMLHYTGHIEDALPEYVRSLELFNKTGEEKGQAEACLGLGDIYSKKDRKNEALEYLNQALVISKRNDYDDFIGEAYWNIGQMLVRAGEHKQALDNLEKATTHAERTNNKRLMGNIFMSMAGVNILRCKYDEAIEANTAGIEILEKLGSKYEIARAYNVMGNIYGGMKDWENSQEPFAKAVKLAEESGNIRYTSMTLSNAAESLTQCGDLETAMAYCEKAEKINKRLGEATLIANNSMVLGLIYHKKEMWDLSEEKYEEALESMKDVEPNYIVTQIHTHYARMLVAADRKEAAIEQYEKAVELHIRLGSKEAAGSVKKEMKKTC